MAPPNTTCGNSGGTPNSCGQIHQVPTSSSGGNPQRARGGSRGGLLPSVWGEPNRPGGMCPREQPKPSSFWPWFQECSKLKSETSTGFWTDPGMFTFLVRVLDDVTTLLINIQLNTPGRASQPALRVLTMVLTFWAATSVVPLCLWERDPHPGHIRHRDPSTSCFRGGAGERTQAPRLRHTGRSAHCRKIEDGTSRILQTRQLLPISVTEMHFLCSQSLAPAQATWGVVIAERPLEPPLSLGHRPGDLPDLGGGQPAPGPGEMSSRLRGPITRPVQVPSGAVP